MNKKLIEQVVLCPVCRENKVVLIEEKGAECSKCGSLIPAVDGYLDILQTQSVPLRAVKKSKSFKCDLQF